MALQNLDCEVHFHCILACTVESYPPWPCSRHSGLPYLSVPRLGAGKLKACSSPAPFHMLCAALSKTYCDMHTQLTVLSAGNEMVSSTTMSLCLARSQSLTWYIEVTHQASTLCKHATIRIERLHLLLASSIAVAPFIASPVRFRAEKLYRSECRSAEAVPGSLFGVQFPVGREDEPAASSKGPSCEV